MAVWFLVSLSTAMHSPSAVVHLHSKSKNTLQTHTTTRHPAPTGISPLLPPSWPAVLLISDVTAILTPELSLDRAAIGIVTE